MTDLHSSEHPEPWYRQFWPWFLITLPACAVVASVWTLVIAVQGSDDLVVDEYYKDGLAINRQLAKKQEASELGIAAHLNIRGDQLEVTVDGPVDEEQLSLYLSHPIEADRDFKVILIRATADTYRARLPQQPAARWYWILESGADSNWRLDGTLTGSNFAQGADS